MSYVNKSETLQQLQGLVQQNLHKSLDYMPAKFNEQQRYALELFQQRISLESIIEESISFNKKLSWENKDKHLNLVTTAEELVEVFKLRSDVFNEVGYKEVFPDTIDGLNFDKYDKNSAIVYYKNNKEITGTVRLIIDSENKLPSESVMSFDNIRKKHKTIGELSRNIIKQGTKGLNLEFKYLMAGVHNVFVNNDIDMTLSGIKKEHFKLCSRFGGIDIVKELDYYGTIKEPCLIISWDPSQASNFFKKAFLK